MRFLGFEFKKASKGQNKYDFSEVDRQASAAVRDTNRRIKLARLNNDLLEVQAQRKQIKEDYGLGDLPEEIEEQGSELTDLMQLVNAFKAQQAPPPAPNPTPPEVLPLQPPKTYTLNPDDIELSKKFAAKMPNHIKKLVKMELVSPEYFQALCQSAYNSIKENA